MLDISNLLNVIPETLEKIQKSLFDQALAFRNENTFTVESFEEFSKKIKKGGFISGGWDGTDETEKIIKEKTKATIRCIPFDENPKGLRCVFSNKPAKHEVIYAKAY